MTGLDGMVAQVTGATVRRAGTAEETAGVVAFLLHDDAADVTGDVVSADGDAAATSTVRPSGGAGAWDPGSVDRRLQPELDEEHR